VCISLMLATYVSIFVTPITIGLKQTEARSSATAMATEGRVESLGSTSSWKPVRQKGMAHLERLRTNAAMAAATPCDVITVLGLSSSRMSAVSRNTKAWTLHALISYSLFSPSVCRLLLKAEPKFSMDTKNAVFWIFHPPKSTHIGNSLPYPRQHRPPPSLVRWGSPTVHLPFLSLQSTTRVL